MQQDVSTAPVRTSQPALEDVAWEKVVQEAPVMLAAEPAEDVEEIPGRVAGQTAIEATFDLSLEVDDTPVCYVRQTMRSGQSVRYDGHVVVIGDVHAGSEVSASGDVTIWGELRGIAHAGMLSARTGQMHPEAEIRALKIEALQLRIADCFARRPDRMMNHKPGGGLPKRPLAAVEVARVVQKEIQIFQDPRA
jgi:septum formation inhibitor MinC